MRARFEVNNRDVEDALLIGVDNARRTLEAGFTTVRDLGSDVHSITALRDGIAAGLVAGPTIVAAGRWHLRVGWARRRGQQHQSGHRGAAARARHQHLRRRRRLPARRAPADLAGRRRHQVHRHRWRDEQRRRRPGPAAVRRRDEGHRRHGPPLRPQGRRPRARRRRHRGGAPRRRRLDRARHLHQPRDQRPVQEVQRLAGADHGRPARRAGAGARRHHQQGDAGQGRGDRRSPTTTTSPRPSRTASASPSAPTRASPSTPRTPRSSRCWSRPG